MPMLQRQAVMRARLLLPALSLDQIWVITITHSHTNMALQLHDHCSMSSRKIGKVQTLQVLRGRVKDNFTS